MESVSTAPPPQFPGTYFAEAFFRGNFLGQFLQGNFKVSLGSYEVWPMHLPVSLRTPPCIHKLTEC